MKRYTLEFLQFLLGQRKARTSDSEAELQLLSRLAERSSLVVEVGVFEGVASARMAESLPTDGRIVLVDPFFPGVLLERFLRFSMAQYIARRQVAKFASRVIWLQQESARAGSQVRELGRADLIFIDARHEYESVAEDFRIWAPLLSDQGCLAFHDSRMCAIRPDLHENVGSVRFVRELEEGKHGRWRIVESVDSVAVVKAV